MTGLAVDSSRRELDSAAAVEPLPAADEATGAFLVLPFEGEGLVGFELPMLFLPPALATLVTVPFNLNDRSTVLRFAQASIIHTRGLASSCSRSGEGRHEISHEVVVSAQPRVGDAYPGVAE